MDLVYDEATAADIIPDNAVVFLCEPARLKDRAENYEWQLNEDVKSLMDAELLDGSIAKYAVTWDETCRRLERLRVVMLDNFTAGRYPLSPKTIVGITAKQLPSYAGNAETAASDIAHYIKTGYRVIVLCQDARRAENLAQYLKNGGIACSCDYELTKMPENGECVIAVGSLSAGFEYPESPACRHDGGGRYLSARSGHGAGRARARRADGLRASPISHRATSSYTSITA